jgi:5-formyltetrahydrofolate cyclo-ligase
VTIEEDLFLRRRVKAELRKRMRGLRATLPAAVRAEKSLRIVERVLLLPPVVQARTVALFWPMEDRNEVDLRPLDQRLRQQGVRVTYPVTDPDTGTLSFRFAGLPETMQVGALGNFEPGPEQRPAAPGEVEVILVPALAVDPRGHRLGYGAGYYDRALPRFCPPATAVCVAFDFQLLVELPNAQDDVPVAWIATEVRTLRAG